MLKKPITFTDPFTKEERTEDFYFNLSKSKLLKKELTTEGGFGEFLKRIAAEGDPKKLIPMFEEIIRDSYGEKVVDPDTGKASFMQSEARSDAFMQTAAYDVLFFELCTDAQKTAEFVNGIVPVDIEEQAEMLAKGRPVPQDHKPKQVNTIELPREDGPYFDKEATEASRTETPDFYNMTPSQAAGTVLNAGKPVDEEYEAYKKWKAEQG